MNQSGPLCRHIDRDTVATVVHEFYRRILAEPELSPFFARINNWSVHEDHITDFWWGLMGGRVESPRPRAMEAGHRELDFGPQELALWLALFEETLQQNLSANLAQQWVMLARRIGEMMGDRGLVRGTTRDPFHK